MSQERKYLWRLSEETGRIIIEIHQKDGTVTSPSFSTDELNSKEKIEARIKEIETNYQLKEIDEKIQEERIIAQETKLKEAIGDPPKKAEPVDVSENIVASLKENILLTAIETGSSLDDVRAEVAAVVEKVGIKADVSKIEFTALEQAKVEESRMVEEKVQ